MTDQKLTMLPVSKIDFLSNNPNRMDDADFNLLCEGLDETGECPAIFVGQRPDKSLVVIDGNHRLKAVKMLGWDKVPALVVQVEDSQEALEIRATRMNLVKGAIQPDRFTSIYNRLVSKMTKPQAMRTLGVVTEKQLGKLLKDAKRKVDVTVVASDEIALLLKRAGIVQDLAIIIRSVIGDSGGAGEFDYVVFQVRGSKVLLLRVANKTHIKIQEKVKELRAKGVNVAQVFLDALTKLT